MTRHTLPTTQDEKIMAALAHGGVIIPFMGVIAPIVIWVSQKDKSPYVAFQALQALAYQLVMILAWFLGMACYMLSFFGLFLTIPIMQPRLPSDGGGELAFMFFPFLVIAAMLLVQLVFFLYGIAGAVLALQGKPFRYWLLGSAVERYLQSG